MDPPGGPPQWASFLIQLDIESLTSVRLPVSQFAHDKTGQAGLSRLRALGATDILFPAERGVPQGDVTSPFGWNAVYDILLRALTIQRRSLTDPSTQAIAYADDLLSVSSTLVSLQQQADLVAAFAAIFELGLAHAKFRAPIPPNSRSPAKIPPSFSESTMQISYFDKQKHSHIWAANMTWTLKDTHNSTTTNSNWTATSTPSAIHQPP
jgi:Reverse transcriptase (RNA-dependent DNA polymerase)